MPSITRLAVTAAAVLGTAFAGAGTAAAGTGFGPCNSCGAIKPDLVIDRVGASNPSDSDSDAFWFVVKNVGGTTAGPSTAAVFWYWPNPEPTPAPMRLSTPALAPGQEWVFYVDPDHVVSRVRTDADSAVTESNEDNNWSRVPGGILYHP